MSEKLKMAIVGAGVISLEVHLRIMMEYAEHFELTAIADPDPAARARGEEIAGKKVAGYDSHHELLEAGGFDAVLVAVPPFLTSPVAIDCIRAGVHVLVEKPMGNTGADALALLEASRTAKGVVMVAENFFFVPGFRKLQKMAADGDWPFGPPLMVQLQQFWKMTPQTIPQFYHSPWRHDERLTWGYLIEGGCHTANPIREAFGMPLEPQARLLSADPKLGKYDTILAQARLEKGPLLQLTASYGLRTQNEHSLELFALDGSISVHGDHWELVNAAGETERIETPYEHRKQDYRDELFAFHAAVIHGRPLELTPEQTYGDIQFMQLLIDKALETTE